MQRERQISSLLMLNTEFTLIIAQWKHESLLTWKHESSLPVQKGNTEAFYGINWKANLWTPIYLEN
jgi:hypothetical protein